MFYSDSLLIPANTLEAAPASVVLPLSAGTVTRVWVRWRWGSANLCGCRILYNEFPFWPLSPGSWYPSSVDSLDFAEAYSLTAEPYQVTLQGYNLDDTFPHTVWVGIEMRRYTLSEPMRQFLADLGESL